ncbi:MAG: hypothetical protein F6K58_23610 [Symploca sp. SIO2E9]|nr:hypothetical protein [Symploca sp. SIO2E9]
MNIILKLVDYTRSKHNITLLYQFHEVTFTTTLWYSTVDFHQLEEEYSQEYMNKLYFHLLLFHGLKILSLKPTHLDLGKFSEYWNPQLKKLWDRSVEQCLGQWKYVSGNLDYQGAEIIGENISSVPIDPIAISPGEVSLLVCNGGGKDSLLMARLLDDHSIQFDSFDINYHTGLNPEWQLELNEQHLYELQNPPSKIHRQYVMESFFNSPAAKLHGVEGLEVSRTKDYESLPLAYGAFGILPIILQYKYTMLCYGNEKSSDKEHVRVRNQNINHAWPKTTECEILYEEYIQGEFIENFIIFSLIKPLSDVLVYQLLAQKVRGNDIKNVYSCNIKPPWCMLCPKCAYVYLSYMAYLKPEQLKDVYSIFNHKNLLDSPELQLYYRQLMGLENHNAFECVGEIEENKLAFEKCVERGISGKAVDCYLQEARLEQNIYQKLWKEYNEIDLSYQRLPKQLEEIIVKEYKELQESLTTQQS